MKIAIFIILSINLCTSCQQKNEVSLLKHQYQKRLQLLARADSMGYKDKASTLLNTIKFTQSDTTIPNVTGTIEKQIIPLWEEERDSAYLHTYHELKEIQKNNTALSSGIVKLVDTANSFVLAYICKNDIQKFLVVLNMDEDNHALEAAMDYPNMETIFCNYDIFIPGPITSSLALRPFEARILKKKIIFKN